MLKAVGDKIIVKEHEKPKQTQGGLSIPSTNKSRHKRGEVISVDSGYKTSVKIGDTIIFGSGSELEHEGQTYVVLNERDIIAII